MRAIHPGEVIREDYLAPLQMSPNALAQALRVPATRIHEIVKERRSITAETAVRLGKYFSTSPELWMNLQSSYDLRKAQETIGAQVEKEVIPLDSDL
ncbi:MULTISPECIES: HigA family addiction module antitoxin [unclassified Dyella]|uniref:HigA family addiction module antitoxin n=1 Tax=unclassified Dyella TaxID=2634549 RepID=UPI002032A1FE|nr:MULTISPECIES: HigA family addiction module antitoxin [unclassified Dyella]